jgi:polar amino acid transport system substrate-binding protein
VPILATGEADISIAPLAVTPARLEVVNFVVYSRSSLCMFGKADNPKLADISTVDDLNRSDLTMAYFTGTPPETWAPERFPDLQFRAVAGSGANAPVEEIISGRADIATVDNVAWPQLARQVPGLVSWPSGDDCLKSDEMSTGVGLAVDKADTVFHDWLQAVYEEVKGEVEAAETAILKGE